MGLTLSSIQVPSGTAKGIQKIDFLVVPEPTALVSPDGGKNYPISSNPEWKKSGIYSYQVTNEDKKRQLFAELIQSMIRYPFQKKLMDIQLQVLEKWKRTHVLSVKMKCFLYANAIRHLILPKTITTIGSYAFAGCSSLSRIDFNHTEKLHIQQYAFADCDHLQDLDLNNMRIGPYAFSGVSPLASVSLFNVDFYEINECETSTGIYPFGTRTVKKNVCRQCPDFLLFSWQDIS